MLQKLNERIQGVVAWLVIILIAMTFTLFGVDYYIQSRQSVDAKAFVNGKPLSSRSFDNAYRRTRSQQEMAQLSPEQDKRVQDQILNQLIANEATIQSANQFGFEVTADQANIAILRIPQFQEDGHFSTQKYQQALSNASFTPETFQNEVRQGILINQQRFAFIGSSFALPDEINRFVRLYLQTRDYNYLIIPASSYVSEAKVSDAEMQDYYDSHKDEFKSPEKISLEYVALSLNELRKKSSVSNDDVKKYYDENQSNFLTPTQWKVAHILFAVPESSSKEDEEQIKQKALSAYETLKANPNQFNQLVASLSDDKLSVADNGQLPWLTAGQSEFDAILSTLNTPNQISAPEKTKHGYEIFKLIDYKPVVTKSYKEVSATIREQLIAEQVQTQYAAALEQLTDLSYQNPDSLVSVSEALKAPVSTTKLFSRSGGYDDLTKNPQLITAAFSEDVLELGNNSEPVQINNDEVVVVRIKEKIPAQILKFGEVKKQVQLILAKQYAAKKALEIGTALLSASESSKQQELMQQNQLQWKKISKATRDNDQGGPYVNDIAFNLQRPDGIDGMSLDNGDYAVVTLVKINDGNLESLDSEQQASLIQQIEASYGMMDYDLYTKSIIKKAEITHG